MIRVAATAVVAVPGRVVPVAMARKPLHPLTVWPTRAPNPSWPVAMANRLVRVKAKARAAGKVVAPAVAKDPDRAVVRVLVQVQVRD